MVVSALLTHFWQNCSQFLISAPGSSHILDFCTTSDLYKVSLCSPPPPPHTHTHQHTPDSVYRWSHVPSYSWSRVVRWLGQLWGTYVQVFRRPTNHVGGGAPGLPNARGAPPERQQPGRTGVRRREGPQETDPQCLLRWIRQGRRYVLKQEKNDGHAVLLVKHRYPMQAVGMWP